MELNRIVKVKKPIKKERKGKEWKEGKERKGKHWKEKERNPEKL